MMRGFCSGFATFARARDLMWTADGSRRINGVRNIRQALASPHPAVRRSRFGVAQQDFRLRIADCRLQIAIEGLIWLSG
jgi:hypothetical protein